MCQPTHKQQLVVVGRHHHAPPFLMHKGGGHEDPEDGSPQKKTVQAYDQLSPQVVRQICIGQCPPPSAGARQHCLLNSPLAVEGAAAATATPAGEPVYAERERSLNLEGVDQIKLANARMLFKQDAKYVRPLQTRSEVAAMKTKWQGRQLKRVGHAIVVFGARDSTADFFDEMIAATRRPAASATPEDINANQQRSDRSDAKKILHARMMVERKLASSCPKASSFDSPITVSPKLYGLESVEMPVQHTTRPTGMLRKMGRIGGKIRRFLGARSSIDCGVTDGPSPALLSAMGHGRKRGAVPGVCSLDL